jgi:quinol monooxygenase YgiN
LRDVGGAPASARTPVDGTLPVMSKISLIAKLTAADGRSSDLEAALAGVVAAAAEEDGLEVYSAHAVDDQPGVYYFFELYRDQDAVDVHGKGDGMRAAMGAFGGLLAGRPEITRMTPVAAKGLDV